MSNNFAGERAFIASLALIAVGTGAERSRNAIRTSTSATSAGCSMACRF